MLKIDHIAIITPNLTTTAWQLQSAGLGSYDGGYNFIDDDGAQRAATAHRPVPLGNDQYIEIEQPIDVQTPGKVNKGLPRYVADLHDRVRQHGPVILAFWVLTDDFDGHARRLGLEEQLHQRVKPDGAVIKSRSAPWSYQAIQRGLPPFFEFTIPLDEWPTRTHALEYEIEPMGVAWLEVTTDRASMEAWLGPEAEQLPLRYSENDDGVAPGISGLGVALANGDVVEIRPSGQFLIITRTTRVQ